MHFGRLGALLIIAVGFAPNTYSSVRKLPKGKSFSFSGDVKGQGKLYFDGQLIGNVQKDGSVLLEPGQQFQKIRRIAVLENGVPVYGVKLSSGEVGHLLLDQKAKKNTLHLLREDGGRKELLVEGLLQTVELPSGEVQTNQYNDEAKPILIFSKKPGNVFGFHDLEMNLHAEIAFDAMGKPMKLAVRKGAGHEEIIRIQGREMYIAAGQNELINQVPKATRSLDQQSVSEFYEMIALVKEGAQEIQRDVNLMTDIARLTRQPW